MKATSAFFCKVWNSTTSAVVSSWNWYAGLPAWQQVGIVVVGVVVIGGTTFLILNRKSEGSTSSGSSSGSSSSADTIDLDLTHTNVNNLGDTKAKICDLLRPFIGD